MLSNHTDHISFEGIIRFFALPGDTEWTQENFKRHWPAMYADAHQRERLLAMETKNILTTAGRNQILTYIASSTITTVAFAQYFAVGTFGIISVSPGDTTVNGEIFRVAPSSTTITGTQIDLQSLLGNSDAVGTLTNCGIFGNGATSTTSSGTLYTHALIANFAKANGVSYACDYLINLQ